MHTGFTLLRFAKTTKRFNNRLVNQGAAHQARLVASAPDSLTAVCPEEKTREKKRRITSAYLLGKMSAKIDHESYLLLLLYGHVCFCLHSEKRKSEIIAVQQNLSMQLISCKDDP